MTRRFWIERCLRQIYNGPPSDDATITINLVNQWLPAAIALAAKANYKEAIAIDGIGYLNNAFYTTFKNISITSDGNFTWKIQLPHIPIGIGRNEGVSVIKIKDSAGNATLPLIPISESQRTYFQSMQPIPNKVIYYYEGEFAYVVSTLLLSQYTADVTMVSGGDGTNLDSTLNVPDDYDSVMVEYIKQQLMFERMAPLDDSNDGRDAIKSV